jgi:hypothetical protein
MPDHRVVSPRQAAVIAGLANVVVIVLGYFANFRVLNRLTEPDDIADSELLFRSGLAALVVMLVAELVVAWGLYVFLQPASRELALFAAWFRLVYVAIAGAALANLLLAANLADGTGQRDAQVTMSVDAYSYGWHIGLASFGAHLLLIGFVMVRSDYAPRILGMVVALAGLGYVVRIIAGVLLPNFEDYGDLLFLVLAVVAVPGVLGLPVWLLWRGGKPAVASTVASAR